MKIANNLIVAIVLGGASSGIFAQSSGDILANVNGSKITQGQLNRWVSVSAETGIKDTPEMRQSILNDLILREVILGDAKKSGLLLQNGNDFKVKQAEQNTIIELWFSRYLRDHPITDAEIKAEYERQLSLSKDPKNAKEFKISQIVSASETDANKIIGLLNAGKSFESLAKEMSIDAGTSQSGGLIGWVLPTQLAAPINDLVPKLSQGQFTSAVQVGSAWYVVKVNEKKTYIFPDPDQAKNSITNLLILQRRQAATKTAIEGAKISRN